MKTYINKMVLPAVIVFLASCTKERPLKFLDSDLRDGLVKKEWVNGAVYDIQTTDEKASPVFEEDKDWLAVNQQTSYKVDTYSIPKQLLFMFKDLYIPAEAEKDYKVLLEADRVGVTAFLLTSDIKSLPLVQQQLAEVKSDEPGVFKVPVFYYAIKSYGKPAAVRNELEEKTNVARLQSTNWDVATHLFLDSTSTQRRPIGLVGNAQRDWERIFLADQMLDRKIKASDLRKYRISTSIEDGKDVVLKAEGSELIVYEVANLSSNLLSETDIALIREGKQNARIQRCDEIENLQTSNTCVLIGRFKVPVSLVSADRNVVDRGGEKGDVIVFRADQNLSSVGLIQITENPIPVDFNPDDTFDPRFHFKAKELLGRKYYLRRTIQDVPRQVPLFFVGEGGPLMIVEFVKKENQIVVKKVEQTINFVNPSSSDVETVMAFNAEYFRAESKDASGRTLKTPRLVKTTALDKSADVIIKLDWKTPIVYSAGSPMGVNDGAGACFSSGKDTQIESFDNRLNNKDRGVLGVTLSATYFPNPNYINYCFGSRPGVASWASGWGGLDSNFTIKERVSFYEHKAEDEKFKGLDIPKEAQKAFAAGFISRPKVLPTKGGIAGFQENYSENILIHDFKKGQKEVWYLVGLPTNYEYKNEIIEMTHKVFADMNQKFKMAFKGTPKETNEDLFEVRIVGIDTNENVVVGDQDKNIIIYEARPTGNSYLGVYQGSGSPTTGKYTKGNIVVFGGNTVGNIESLQWVAKIRKQYRETYNSVVKAFAKENNIPLANSSTNGDKKASALGQILQNMFPIGTPVENPKIVSPSQLVAPLIPDFTGLEDFSQLPVPLKPNYRLGFDVKKNLSGVKKLSDLLDLKTISQKFERASPSGKLNISKLLDTALNDGQITQEQYNYAIFQRVFDKVIEQKGVDGFLKEPKFVESLVMEEFMKNPPLEIDSEQLSEIQSAHSKLMYQNAKSSFYKSTATPHCFFEAPALDDFVFEQRTFADIFKNFYAGTLEHELLHNMGLEHQFEGSYDGKNFEFEGQKEGRLTSGIMDYGTVEESANWRGMGPHDVHAIRLAYTGYVEVDQSLVKELKAQNSTSISISDDTKVVGKLNFLNGKYVSIHEFRKLIYNNMDWNEFSEDHIRNSPIKLKHFEYCSNADIGIDPTCMMHDKGTTVPEIVTNMANDHWQKYWVTNFENDRYKFGILNLIRNMYGTMSSLQRMRSFTDALLARVLLQGRGRNFEQPKTYDDSLNLELFNASIFTRDYMLAFIRTPDPKEFTPGLSTNNFMPLKVTLSLDSGASIDSVGIVESRSTYMSTSSDQRFNTIGNYLDKLVAMEVLTQKMSSRTGLLNNDLAVPSQFSYLEFEKFLMNINRANESPILIMLTDFLTQDIKPMILVGKTRNFPLDVPEEMGKIEIPNALSFTAAKAAVFNTYSSSLLDEYNFSNLFRVYSVRGTLPSELGPIKSVVDLSYSHDTNSQRRYFADGGPDSYLANGIVNQNAIYRTVLDHNTDLTKDIDSYISMLLSYKFAYDLNSDNEIKRNQAKGKLKRISETRAKLLTRFQSEFNLSAEVAVRLLEPMDTLPSSLPDLFGRVAQSLKVSDMNSIRALNESVQDLAVANPFLYSGMHFYIEGLKKKNVSELMGLPLDIAEQFFSMDYYVYKYSSTKSNLDMMNIFYSYIEPSARNR